ncbi:MATE family efflux transporter [Helicobacter sp. 10-6591]|uniref:MATE family efflux transporter n=1 Tax=Helicobacter sp. 10-6591 TaxID=2004998 RepID=UPI0015EC1A67|nr:MATE family efflux transporter [Helicobacter sp. 10-6591]
MTKKSPDLGRDSPIRLFFYFFVPNLCAMLALSTYSTFDGIFVGKAIGDKALAAIGVCWPVFPALIAFELLFGMGGASIASYYLGKGDEYRARLMFSSVCYFAFLSSIFLGVVLFCLKEEIALALGANTEIMPLAVEYLGVIFLGSFIMILHPLLDVFAINDKRPFLAMVAMIIGSLSNIVLNYLFLFVFGLGILGAALATILGHLIGICILLMHFVCKRGKIYFVKAFSYNLLFASMKNGLPQSFSEISAGFVMILFNHKLNALGGSEALSIYSILIYSGTIIFTIILSCAQGVQPIASFNYGARALARVKRIFCFGVIFASVCGVILFMVFYVFDKFIVGLFLREDSEYLLESACYALNIHFIGYMFLGFNFVSAIFLQSIQRPLSSFIVTLSTNFMFVIILLYILSGVFGLDGVWASYPLSLVCASFITSLVLYYEFNKGILRSPLATKAR